MATIIETNLPEFRAQMESLQVRLLGQLKLGLNTGLRRLQSYIASEKLSGQVLKVKTGTLRRSVRMIPAEEEGASLVGSVASSGGPAFYGRFHEFGVPHSWEIMARTARALRFVVDGKVVFAKRVTHPPLPERSFMRSSLAEQQEMLLSSIRESLRR